MKPLNKKGVINFSNAPRLVLLLGFTVMIVAAVVISLGGMKSAVTTADGQGALENTSTANATIDNGITGLSNFSGQFGTIGTMMGVGLLLLIVIGVFGALALNRMGGDL